MWQQWINGALGLIVLVLAFTSGLSTDLMWTLGIIGLAVALMGFWGAFSHSDMKHIATR